MRLIYAYGLALLMSCCKSMNSLCIEDIKDINPSNVLYFEVFKLKGDKTEYDINVYNRNDLRKVLNSLKKSYPVNWESVPAKYGRESYNLVFYFRNGESKELIVLKTIYGFARIQCVDENIIRNDNVVEILDNIK